MRLQGWLRPLRLMSLLKSLRPLRFLIPGKSLSMLSACCLWFLEDKKTVEFIEASDIIMPVEVIDATEVFRTTHILKINNLTWQNHLILMFWKKEFFEYPPGILVKFCPPSELRLWRTGMLLLTKSKGHTSNFHYSGFPNHLQTKSNLHISIRQSQILCVKT